MELVNTGYSFFLQMAKLKYAAILSLKQKAIKWPYMYFWQHAETGWLLNNNTLLNHLSQFQ